MTRDELERIGRLENRHDGTASVGSLSYTPCNLDATNDPRDVEAMAAVYNTLALYCEWKRLAMIARLEGRIAAAVPLETKAEHSYRQLPEWARW